MTIIWTVVVTYVILKLISLVSKLRVKEDEETTGLDTTSHGESGYNL